MINRVVLVGRMTRSPELRRTPNGSAVANFTLAVNRTFTSANGERQADFISCIVWNKTAENVIQYCGKGSLVGVEGRIQSRQYDSKDGSKRTVVEVVCDSIQFVETKGISKNEQPRQEISQPAKDIEKNDFPQNFDIDDLDIQF